MLAGNQPPLPIARIAIGKLGRLAKNTDRPSAMVEAHDFVIRDIAPQKAITIAKPDRPFAPTESGSKTFDGTERLEIPPEFRVQNLEGWIRIKG